MEMETGTFKASGPPCIRYVYPHTRWVLRSQRRDAHFQVNDPRSRSFSSLFDSESAGVGQMREYEHPIAFSRAATSATRNTQTPSSLRLILKRLRLNEPPADQLSGDLI